MTCEAGLLTHCRQFSQEMHLWKKGSKGLLQFCLYSLFFLFVILPPIFFLVLMMITVVSYHLLYLYYIAFVFAARQTISLVAVHVGLIWAA